MQFFAKTNMVNNLNDDNNHISVIYDSILCEYSNKIDRVEKNR